MDSIFTVNIIMIIIGIIMIIIGCCRMKSQLNEQEKNRNKNFTNNSNNSSLSNSHSSIQSTHNYKDNTLNNIDDNKEDYEEYVNVKFDNYARIYTYLAPNNKFLKTGERIRVMTNDGIKYVTVVKGNYKCPRKKDMLYKRIDIR